MPNYKGKPIITKDAWSEIAAAHHRCFEGLLNVFLADGFDQESEAGALLKVELVLAYRRMREAYVKAKSIRPGRPRMPIKVGTGGLLSTAMPDAGYLKSESLDHDSVVYKTIERVRQEQQAANKTSGTVTAAIDAAIVSLLAPSLGMNRMDAMRRLRGSVQSKYSRGKLKSRR